MHDRYGTQKFRVDEVVSQWKFEIEVLSQIAKVEPQAAYCCFTTGFKHKGYLLYAYSTQHKWRIEMVRWCN